MTADIANTTTSSNRDTSADQWPADVLKAKISVSTK